MNPKTIAAWNARQGWALMPAKSGPARRHYFARGRSFCGRFRDFAGPFDGDRLLGMVNACPVCKQRAACIAAALAEEAA